MSVIEHKFFLSEQIPNSYRDKVERCRKDLFADMQNIPLLLSSETDEDIIKIKNIARRIENDFKFLVIIGTGASESIPRMFCNLGRPKLQIEFLMTLDQYTFDAVLNRCNLKETAFLVISKSGVTVEVTALTLFLIRKMRDELGNKISTHFYFITSENTPIFKLAKDIGATILKHANIGGRFASFSSLGFLSAALSGMNVDALIDDAKEAFLELIQPDSWVMEGVEYNYFMSHKFSSNIFMYYHDSLYGLSLWVRQLIAESLGKDGKGLNSIVSNGVLDHHSQLQLYLEGLNDKFFTVLSFKSQEVRKDYFVSEEEIAKYGLDFNSDTTLYSIHELQMNLAIEALIESNKNVRVITSLNSGEKFIAEFVMGMMLEVMMFAYLIDINPFGQPAVEIMKEKLKR